MKSWEQLLDRMGMERPGMTVSVSTGGRGNGRKSVEIRLRFRRNGNILNRFSIISSMDAFVHNAQCSTVYLFWSLLTVCRFLLSC